MIVFNCRCDIPIMTHVCSKFKVLGSGRFIMASSNQPGTKSCSDCVKKCGKGKISEEVTKQLNDAFDKLNESSSTSLLKRFLTRDVYDEIMDISTPMGSTLLDCIQSGVENLDSGIGVYAADADCYMAFAPLFDAIIEEYHRFGKQQKQPPLHWGDPSVFSNLDDNAEFIVSTRVRCGRSLKGFPFNPRATEAQYKELEQRVSSFLSGLKGELKGKYYPLATMSKQIQQQLIDEHLLFKEGDRFLKSANAIRYWPVGRGIFFNEAKTFLVWINEEDHLRIISMQLGGDLYAVYKRFVQGVSELDTNLKFSHDPRLGYLTFCPTNLGTGIRASVHIKLPKLSANMEKLEEIAKRFNLQVRGTAGEHSEVIDNTLDISNKRRIGITEFEVVKEMYDGIKEMINIERSS